MKRKKKKIIVIFIFIFVIWMFQRNSSFNDIFYNINKIISKISNTSEYKIIKQDKNNNYSGIGQEIVKNKDGYFTTFSTVEKNKKTYIEYKQNGNSSWSNNKYWGRNYVRKWLWHNCTFNYFKWL